MMLFSRLAFWKRNQPKKSSHVGLCFSKNGMAIVCGEYGAESFVLSIDDARKILDEWVLQFSLKGCGASIVLAHDDYDLFQMDRPDVEDADLQSATHWKLSEFISYSPAEAVSDVFEIPDSQYGAGRQVYVCAARLERLKNLVSVVKDAGLIIESIDIADLAIRNIAKSAIHKPTEVALGAIGLIVIYKDISRLYICESDTFYLSRIIKIAQHQVEVDDAVHQAEIADQYALEIQRTLDYFDSHFGRSKVSQLHFLGMTDSQMWLPEKIEGYLGLKSVNFQMAYTVKDRSDLVLLALGGSLSANKVSL